MDIRQCGYRLVLVLSTCFMLPVHADSMSKEQCAAMYEDEKAMLDGQHQVKAMQLEHQYKMKVTMLEARQRRKLAVLKARHQKEILLLEVKVARLSKASKHE